MAKCKAIILLSALLAALSSCSAFFDFNAFAALDTRSAPKLSDIQGPGGLSTLAADLASPSMVAALKADPATTLLIKSYLVTTYGVTAGPLTTPDQQAAAVLYSDLNLKTTSGDQLVNNIVSVIVSTPASGTKISSILSSIIPADVAQDATKFAAMVNGLLDANKAYTALGNSIPPAPPGVNLGDVAQKAAVACTMQAVVNAVMTSASTDSAGAVTQMFKLVNKQTNTIANATLASDPLNPLPSPLKNIFDAAGLPAPGPRNAESRVHRPDLSLPRGGIGFPAIIAEEPFVPVSPQVMAIGGSFVAEAHGYDAFFYNPAGFSRDNGSFTLGSGDVWAYSRPDALLGIGQQLLTGASTPAATLSFMNGQVTQGGLGAGSSIGIGYVGNGLGLGMVLIVDSFLSGPSLLGLSGDLTGTIGFIGGLSVPFDLGGITVHVGGDIRPMIRIHAPLTSRVAFGMLSALATNADVIAALGTADALYGVGVGLDFGVIAELGWLTAGVAVRDFAGTQFKYDDTTFNTLTSTFTSQMKLPAGNAVTSDQYVIPMDISVGFALHPDLGAFNYFVDPSISIGMSDLVGVVGGARSVWTALHVGADIKVISMFSVRGGLNQGYLTVGAGMKLLFLDLSVAAFTRELGTHVGDQPSSGATLELAFRW